MLPGAFLISRPTPTHTLHLIYVLSVLHTYTGLLTVADALQHNDNEAIIQLSVDSIHVVKPSDSRFADIEEHINDNEEKELLLALLTSFDDDYERSFESTDTGSSTEHQDREATLSINNCTSSSSSMSTLATASSSSSVSLRLVPSALDFGEQAIAIPLMQTVVIINDHLEPLELHSLSGTTVQFYSSFFTQKTLAPHGGNTSIHVYFLPRTHGTTKSTFTIKTSRGTFQYYVSGTGTSNPFHLRPLIGATIPLNSSFEYGVHFYNPYNYSIDIDEIYTSDENLIIELITQKGYRNRMRKTLEHEEQWHIEPYQMKPIVKIHYLGYKLDHLHGFYCIKTNANDTIVVPVEINVVDDLSLYSNVDLLEFNIDGLVRSGSMPMTVPVYVINNGNTPVTITNVRLAAPHVNYITIEHGDVQVPVGIHRLNKIADLTIHPQLVPPDIHLVRGSVQIYASSSPDDENPILEVPFLANILHGALDYDAESANVYIPSSSTVENNGKVAECRPVLLTNHFDVPLTIFNISTDNPELLSEYIQITYFSSYIQLQPDESIVPLCITVLPRSSSANAFSNFKATLSLHTNLSYFLLPFYFYDGLLSLNPITDKSNGGITWNETSLSEFFVASIPVRTSRTVRFAVSNTNPIDLSIDKVSIAFTHSVIQLVEIQLLDGSASTYTVEKPSKSNSQTPIIIPAHHQAIFALTITATDVPGSFNGKITFRTRYESLIMYMNYNFVAGSMDLNNQVPLHIDVFPNRVGTIDLQLKNGFNKEIEMTRIEFSSYGVCFWIDWNNTSPGRLLLEAHQERHIGLLSFDMTPLCSDGQIPSESTCYCGLNHHRGFKQRWDEHVSALDSYELDQTLVLKFRHLWNEWTSLVRQQRIEANIWLVADQANGSWPITIGFVWPSVLEHMSSSPVTRTPITLDFHLTLINTTKTRRVIISNPSSTSVSYSVELINNYESRTKRAKQVSMDDENRVYDISTTPKLVDITNGTHRFILAPNEQRIFTVSFHPKSSSKQQMYLVVRNSLTIIESVLLRGEGASGSLTVGNRKAGSSDIPLVLEMNESQYQLCSDYPTTNGIRGNPVLVKTVALRNTGNVQVVINDISFGSSKCSGQGFSAPVCSNIVIEPNERYDLTFRYQPDYTLAEINDILVLNSNIGLLTFSIIVRIPQRVLAACYQMIPRPTWEPKTRWLCAFSAPVILGIVLSIARGDAKRLFDHYLARVELRCRLRDEKENMCSLTDLTASQDEFNIRERTDSRTSPSLAPPKKETVTQEQKPKPLENKPKRSVPSTNGVKDTGDIASRIQRTPNGAAATTERSVPVSPKATAHKARRSTIESGPPKPAKQQNEPTVTAAIKLPAVRTQKSVNTDQQTTVLPRSPSPQPASSVSDNESEPFVIARAKRNSIKPKESTNQLTATKSNPTNDGVTPVRRTPSPSPPPVPPTISQTLNTTVQKIILSSDPSEQEHLQRDLSQSTDPINDQQWQMVSSNRAQRKGTAPMTSRRDPADESQAGNKPNKSVSTNSDFGRYVSLTEQNTEESIDTSEWVQGSASAIADIPPLMSIPTTLSGSVGTANPLSRPAIFSPPVPDEIEPLPFLPHGPGPIQRPNKLFSQPMPSPASSTLHVASSVQTPQTPDVLDQINHLLYEQSTNASVGAGKSNANHGSVTSSLSNDLTTPNVSWSAFSPIEWPSKNDSSWPLTNIQSPTMPLTPQVQNPFALMATMHGPQRQPPHGEYPVWSPALGTATTRYVSSTNRTQRATTWNELFSSTVPSAAESTKLTNSPWMKLWSAPDPSANDGTALNGHQPASNSPFWNMPTLSNDAVVPSGIQVQRQNSSSGWWSAAPSDENNNNNQFNQSNGDTATARDQSRWDFAR